MKKAFSLIELLIVILIIGVIYTLSISNFKKINQHNEKVLTLKNLKEYLQSIKHENSVELICLDDCSSCDIFVDKQKYTLKAIDGFLDKSLKVYRYDFNFGMVEKIYNNDVCFSYSIDKKGIGDQLIVGYNGRFYDYTTYLYPTEVYNSLEDIIEVKENLVQEILR